MWLGNTLRESGRGRTAAPAAAVGPAVDRLDRTMSAIPATPPASVTAPTRPRAIALPAVGTPAGSVRPAPGRRALAATNHRCIAAAWSDDPRVLAYLLG